MGVLGILTLSETYNENDTICFYNSDGSLWHKLSLYYDDSDGVYEFQNSAFYPFAFHPDYFLFALAVVKELNDRYIVIVDHRIRLEKIIYKSDFLKLEKLEEFILSSVFSVEFNKNNNPIRIHLLEKP